MTYAAARALATYSSIWSGQNKLVKQNSEIVHDVIRFPQPPALAREPDALGDATCVLHVVGKVFENAQLEYLIQTALGLEELHEACPLFFTQLRDVQKTLRWY